MTMPELRELYKALAGTECAMPNQSYYEENNVPNYDEHLAEYNANQEAINYIANNDVISIFNDAVERKVSDKTLVAIAQKLEQAVKDGYTIHYYDDAAEQAIIGVK